MPKPAPAPPLPASLLEEGGAALPPVEVLAFCFGALIMRVTDSGGVNTDVISGYNYAHSLEQAQGDFTSSVARQYPGWSLTKVTSQVVQPLAAVPAQDEALREA